MRVPLFLCIVHLITTQERYSAISIILSRHGGPNSVCNPVCNFLFFDW